MVRSILLVFGVLALARTVQAEEKEPAIPGEGARVAFLRAAHARLHQGWVNMVRNAGEGLPASHPLNDRTRTAVIAVTVISDGTVADARVDRGSGSADFDAAALGVFATGSQLPPPPNDALSDDNRAYLRWTFARDARACSGVAVVSKEDPLEAALPQLLSKRRDLEALRRVRIAALSSPDVAIGTWARAWLERALELSRQSVQAAIGLAATGDARGVAVLRGALAREEQVAQVTAALVRLNLSTARPAATEAPGPARSTDALARALHKGDRAARLAAAAALAQRFDAGARRALASLSRDSDPELRFLGAAALDVKGRAEAIAAVGPQGHTAYRALAQGPARSLAGDWLLAQFDSLPSPVQSEVLSHWLWTSRSAPIPTLSAR